MQSKTRIINNYSTIDITGWQGKYLVCSERESDTRPPLLSKLQLVLIWPARSNNKNTRKNGTPQHEGKYEEKETWHLRRKSEVTTEEKNSHIRESLAASQEERRNSPSHGVTTFPTPGDNEDNEKTSSKQL